MNRAVHLVEHRGGTEDGWTDFWMVTPPKPDEPFRVTDGRWNEDHSERHIYKWESASYDPERRRR